ncbi:glycoside hydrolase domain-containing protein [Dongshaea marina]|uniref:glycoside hydrolase domain-containing protein n=1 Tax=Dongshaea marina TaxID=2047966 RepID=UPI002277A0C7|nr:glycoside hydrolase domain-containing protein [Dongshaea marina]
MDPNRALTYSDYHCFGDKPAGTSPGKAVHPLFANAPDGLSGDEDNGSMSAWYLNSAMGFHPLPGTSRIEFGSPLFNKMVIRVPAYRDQPARSLVISAPNNSQSNIYVKSISLNGKPLNKLAASNYGMDQNQLFANSNHAVLKFDMQEQPAG